jgi:FMN phosphatase YigB (HAD superfamily)
VKPLYIFDLDGTLAAIEHRRHFVEAPMIQAPAALGGQMKDPNFKPNWPAFFAACTDDGPNYPVIDTLHSLLKSGAEVWIWSGRSSEVMEQTKAWLMEHVNRENLELCMRVEGDYTPDDELKRSWLMGMRPADRRRLVAVFDDRQKVVDMWRANGVACFQVAPGDF